MSVLVPDIVTVFLSRHVDDHRVLLVENLDAVAVEFDELLDLLLRRLRVAVETLVVPSRRLFPA